MTTKYNSEKYKKWYSEHKEEQKQRKLKYYKRNREKINEKRNEMLRKKYADNPDYRDLILEKQKIRYSLNPEPNKMRAIEWHDMMIKKIIEKLGGKCSRCGYNTIPEVLQFHHIFPTKKDTRNTRKEAIKIFREGKNLEEIFVLLCPTCHMEVHYELRQNERIR